MITARVFDTVPGSTSISHFSLFGAHIYWVQREGLSYSEASGFTPGNREFKKTGVKISFLNPFTGSLANDVREKVWVLYEIV